MLRTIKYQLWPKDIIFSFKIEELVNLIIKEFGYRITEEGSRHADSTFTIAINECDHIRFENYNKFIEYFKQIPEYETFDCNICFSSKMRLGLVKHGLWIEYRKYNIEITCHSEDAHFVDRSHEITKNILNLQRIIRHDPDEYRWKYLDPSIFISRHFDEETDKYFSKLERFLSLLGFNVNQGEEYTSSQIPEKVKHRMDKQDIIIVIVSGQREHDWLISEIGFATGKNKHIIVLKESNANINPAILGKDLEYLEFKKGYIETSYNDLLQEFRSIRVKGIF